MSVEETRTVTIAGTRVNDDYGVDLLVRRKLTKLDPDQAVQLANELMQSAASARELMREDLVSNRERAGGFDVDGRITAACGDDRCGDCGGLVYVGEVAGRRSFGECTHRCHTAEADPAEEAGR